MKKEVAASNPELCQSVARSALQDPSPMRENCSCIQCWIRIQLTCPGGSSCNQRFASSISQRRTARRLGCVVSGFGSEHTFISFTVGSPRIARAASQSRRARTTFSRRSCSTRCRQGHQPPYGSGRRADIFLGRQVWLDDHRGENRARVREREGGRTCGARRNCAAADLTAEQCNGGGRRRNRLLQSRSATAVAICLCVNRLGHKSSNKRSAAFVWRNVGRLQMGCWSFAEPWCRADAARVGHNKPLNFT